MQELEVSPMLEKQAAVAGGPSVAFYYNPKRDGDVKARIKALADKLGGQFPPRYSESDWARRLVLAALEAEERKLGPRRDRGSQRQRRKAS